MKHILEYICLVTFILVLSCTICVATVTTDGTLGPATALNGPNYVIPQDMGHTNGYNLFHSFETFNLYLGESALFTGSDSLENIITRVTGGNPSWIDGVMRCLIPGANLYFINPYGVIFGSHASLDINGSFYASSADYLKLGNNGIIFSDPMKGSKLTSAAPSAFGFINPMPSKIIVDGSYLSNKESISIIAGDIEILDSSLVSPGGRINLSSVGSKGEVVINNDGIDMDKVDKQGKITISTSESYNSNINFFLLDLEENPENVFYDNFLNFLFSDRVFNFEWRHRLGKFSGLFGNIDVSGDEGGSVFITANSVTMDHVEILSHTTGESNSNGIININVQESFVLDNGSTVYAHNYGTGNSGDINFQVKNLNILNGSQISTSSYGEGKGGTITVHADTIYSEGFIADDFEQPLYPSGFFSVSESIGQGGSIDLYTSTLMIKCGSQFRVSSLGEGDGGIMKVNADTVMIDGFASNIDGFPTFQSGLYSGANGPGDAGDISIQAENISITNGGQISVNTNTSGEGGKLSIVTENLSIDGYSTANQLIPFFPSMIFSTASNTGGAGDIDINAQSVSLTNGGNISLVSKAEGNGGNLFIDAGSLIIDGYRMSSSQWNTVDASGLYSYSEMGGDAGNMTIHSNTIKMTNGAKINASSFGTGDGGNIEIDASSLSIDGFFRDQYDQALSSTQIVSEGHATGNAGSIIIDSNRLSLTNGGVISVAGINEADSGTIDIDAGTVKIDGTIIHDPMADLQTGLFSTTIDGDGGNITIDCNEFTLKDGAFISASSSGKGEAGSIDMSVSGSFTCNGSDIQTESAYSTGGDIEIRASNMAIEQNSRISASILKNGIRGGNILIESNQFALSGGSSISSSTDGDGEGGSIRISVASNAQIQDDKTGIFSTTSGDGDAGSISINASDLFVKDGAQMSASSSGLGSGDGGDIWINAENSVTVADSEIYSSSDGAGAAGSISVDTPILTLTDSGKISTSASGNGMAGSIDIHVANLNMDSESIISSASSGSGNAGNIIISVASKLESRDSTITTEATQADGGDIVIDTGFLVWLIDSPVTATVGGGPETSGGNVKIDSQYIVLNNSQIIANAYEGSGGKIDITAGTYLADWNSIVSASSTLGISGEVNIEAPLANLSGLLTPLTTPFMDISNLLADDCETRFKKRNHSSLVIRGRDAVPALPGDIWPCPVMIK
ncbi:MAG: filamentous hemagglutinin N-terminal domain-containing protein [Calditrichaceae bacterium]